MKILVIEICNFFDYPTGGQLSFVRNMMKAYGEELCLAGCTTDDTPVGEWVRKDIDGTVYDFFSVLHTEKSSRKPLIPNRIKGYVALKRHISGILDHKFDRIFIQAPEVLFALPYEVMSKVAVDLPGLTNPLLVSRYPMAKVFAGMYDRLFLKKLGKAGHIWATACSQDIEDLVSRSRGMISARQVEQLPTRYDGNIFRPLGREDCRKAIGLDNDMKLLVSVGRLNRHKGWELMLGMLSCLSGRSEDFRLALIGDGEDEDGIIRLGENLGIRDRLIMTGRLPADEIALWLNSSDVFVMGSEKEGWSTTLVEACACGIPCVVTDFSSAEDMVRDGVNGFVLKQRAPELFAEKVLEALALDPETVKAYDSSFSRLAIDRLPEEMSHVFSHKDD